MRDESFQLLRTSKGPIPQDVKVVTSKKSALRPRAVDMGVQEMHLVSKRKRDLAVCGVSHSTREHTARVAFRAAARGRITDAAGSSTQRQRCTRV